MFVNGQKVATLGIGGKGVLSAIVNWVDGRWRREGGEFSMDLGGLDSVVGEHVRWPAPPLTVGDEVTIRLLEVEQVDAPTERKPSAPPAPEAPGRVRYRQIRERVTHVLRVWREHQSEPWGQVLSGEACVRFQSGADTEVGVDVVYAPAGVAARESGEAPLLDGVPVLAVEILSPHDTMAVIGEKIDSCLAAGVPLLWVINPHWRTVMIYRPGEEPEMVNVRQELSGEPHLPGFRVPVAQLFG